MRKGFPGRLAIVLLAAAVMVVTLVGLAYMGGALRPGVADYHVDAVMPTVSSLIPGARVTMAGAQVGQVGSVSRRGNGAFVQLDITDRHVTPIPADSRVALREVTPIGENYVEITPGHAGAKLSSGAVLPMAQSSAYVDVDQLLSVLQGSRTQRTRQLIQGIGDAVAGRGAELNGTLAGVSNSFHPLANVVRVLDSDRASVQQLVRELGNVAAAAGERGASIIQLANSGLATFRALATQDSNLRATLQQLPSTLGQVRVTAGTLGSVSDTAAPVIQNLAGALHDLRPAITSLQPAAAEGRTVVRQLAATAPRLQTTLRNARGLATPATGALPRIKQVLCQANPMLRYIQPYTQDITSFISSFGSAVNGYDGIGHLVRLVPILGDNSVSGLPPAISQAAHQLLHAGIMANSTALSWDPYPKPGQIGTEHATAANEAIGPADLKAKTGYVYPHVTADC
jgi:virulence factor Mce-like protein